MCIVMYSHMHILRITIYLNYPGLSVTQHCPLDTISYFVCVFFFSQILNILYCFVSYSHDFLSISKISD